MLSDGLQSALNEQMNKEFYSEYLYLSMAAYCASINLSGFENWFKVQAQEEHMHGMKFYTYINSRRGRVVVSDMDKPQEDFSSIVDIYETGLKHEGVVTASINNLMDIAIKESDHSAKTYLQWFVTEQDEEEESFDNILTRLKLIGSDNAALFMLDTELGQRIFTPPPVV
jgi:ferritin